jgi:molybdopterin molybdotransferase
MIAAAMEDLDVSGLLTVSQATSIIDAARVSPRVETAPLADAQGRRLAEEIVADRDAPPFDKSQMDGYAVRCADVAAAPAELSVVAEIAAGSLAPRPLEAGEAMAIMTGAPMPPGADGVVPVEETERQGDKVTSRNSTTRGRYIAPRGSDARAGQILLKPGLVLEARHLAVAASVGKPQLRVYARPRVAVLSTGDELVQVHETPGPTQIRNSNNTMLVALLRKFGCDVADHGTAADSPEAITAAIEAALRDADVLFITGGMSMGTRDYVPTVISNLKFETRVSKLRIKPGKPFVFAVGEGSGFRVQGSGSADKPRAEAAGDASGPSSGEKGDVEPSPSPKYIFGLPGNPVSGFVSTIRLASRLLARLAGGEPREKWIAGKIDVGLGPNGPREFYQPVVWTQPQGGTSNRNEFATVSLLTWKGSADLFTLAIANGLLVRSENEPPLARGTLVRVLEI